MYVLLKIMRLKPMLGTTILLQQKNKNKTKALPLHKQHLISAFSHQGCFVLPEIQIYWLSVQVVHQWYTLLDTKVRIPIEFIFCVYCLFHFKGRAVAAGSIRKTDKNPQGTFWILKLTKIWAVYYENNKSLTTSAML